MKPCGLGPFDLRVVWPASRLGAVMKGGCGVSAIFAVEVRDSSPEAARAWRAERAKESAESLANKLSFFSLVNYPLPLREGDRA